MSANAKPTYDVFISYSSPDRPSAPGCLCSPGGPPDSVLDRAAGHCPGTEWGASIIDEVPNGDIIDCRRPLHNLGKS